MQEALPHNITITCVCPGAVITPIYDTATVRGFKPEVKAKFSESLLHSGELPEKTAKATVKAASRNQFLLITTPFANLMYYIRLCFAFAWYPLMKVAAGKWENYFKQYRQ